MPRFSRKECIAEIAEEISAEEISAVEEKALEEWGGMSLRESFDFWLEINKIKTDDTLT